MAQLPETLSLSVVHRVQLSDGRYHRRECYVSPACGRCYWEKKLKGRAYVDIPSIQSTVVFRVYKVIEPVLYARGLTT